MNGVKTLNLLSRTFAEVLHSLILNGRSSLVVDLLTTKPTHKEKQDKEGGREYSIKG